MTIVDMGELPESHVSLPELSDLMHKWPPAVINHMVWRQRELEEMRAAAKVKYQQSHPSICTFCGTLIKCDMYRHVARCHLDMAQLWRCPVSWCTIWKGVPQDFIIRNASLEKFFSAMDSHTPGVYGLTDVSTLRYRRIEGAL